MTVLWCPTATHKPITGLAGGGSMLGGKPRAVHHTTEGSTAAGAEATYAKTGNAPHITADYARDIVEQHLPVNVAATAVRNEPGGVETNRQGSVCVQIEWVGQAAHPFTAGHKAGPKVKGLLDWLRSLGIPDVWPMGPPKAYPGSYGASNGDRDPKVWAASAGHYGHSQVPENVHGDPGAIDPAFVKQTAKPAPKPAPAPVYRYTHLPLKHGDANVDVAHAQKRLGVAVDGRFGDVTEAHVKAFQKAHRLTVDGVVGPVTAKALG
jgi:peptidoglycan hydrolase-like protein with peptidoglycan-binding domain